MICYCAHHEHMEEFFSVPSLVSVIGSLCGTAGVFVTVVDVARHEKVSQHQLSFDLLQLFWAYHAPCFVFVR